MTDTAVKPNVCVIGAGPAGLALAAACAEARLAVLLVDPNLGDPLPNTYGVWTDQVDLPITCFARRWSRPLVCSDVDGEQELSREYGLLDNAALVRWYRDRLEQAGGLALRASVTRVHADAEGGTVVLDSGETVHTDVVVDCTGSAKRFLETRRPRAQDVAWQTAYGIVADVDHLPWDTDQIVLMDYRSVSTPDGAVPSFLYAMPLGGRRVLLEETVLAAVPAVPLRDLAARLDVRLESLGISVDTVHHVEDVRIPMDQPLPRIPQPVVGYGAAAGFVHPATGYSVARSLVRAPVVARAIADGLATGGPARASRRAWQAVQPRSRRRAHHLARSGLQALLALGPEALGQFMHHFFAMPQQHSAAFLSGTSSPRAILGAMFTLGRYLPFALAWRVTHLVARRGAADLIAGLVPGLETDVRFPS